MIYLDSVIIIGVLFVINRYGFSVVVDFAIIVVPESVHVGVQKNHNEWEH